jgi:hypothetical protein
VTEFYADDLSLAWRVLIGGHWIDVWPGTEQEPCRRASRARVVTMLAADGLETAFDLDQVQAVQSAGSPKSALEGMLRFAVGQGQGRPNLKFVLFKQTRRVSDIKNREGIQVSEFDCSHAGVDQLFELWESEKVDYDCVRVTPYEQSAFSVSFEDGPLAESLTGYTVEVHDVGDDCKIHELTWEELKQASGSSIGDDKLLQILPWRKGAIAGRIPGQIG